jgi:hypothetical protein
MNLRNWWHSLSEKEQVCVDASVRLLELLGPSLKFPHSSGVKGSRHGHLRELRIQFGGRPLRSLYAFDPRRRAILLIGGDKTGNDRWYEEYVPIADDLGRMGDVHKKIRNSRAETQRRREGTEVGGRRSEDGGQKHRRQGSGIRS